MVLIFVINSTFHLSYDDTFFCHFSVGILIYEIIMLLFCVKQCKKCCSLNP
jgi:hypothetical protein